MPDVDGWRMKDHFQRIFLSSDPDYDDLKAFIHDFLYMPWLTGAFLPEFAPEWASSYLIALEKPKMEKPNGGIRGVVPVDIWRRATGNAVVQPYALNSPWMFLQVKLLATTRLASTLMLILRQQNRGTSRRLPRVYGILSSYSPSLGSHFWEISRY